MKKTTVCVLLLSYFVLNSQFPVLAKDIKAKSMDAINSQTPIGSELSFFIQQKEKDEYILHSVVRNKIAPKWFNKSEKLLLEHKQICKNDYCYNIADNRHY